MVNWAFFCDVVSHINLLVDNILKMYNFNVNLTSKNFYWKESALSKDIMEKYKKRAVIIKALAHPTRLFIVEELSKQEKCVCDLAQMVNADISTVSKHLSVLKNAGIVQDTKRGSQVYYSLKVPCIMNLFSCVENVVKSNFKE